MEISVPVPQLLQQYRHGIESMAEVLRSVNDRITSSDLWAYDNGLHDIIVLTKLFDICANSTGVIIPGLIEEPWGRSIWKDIDRIEFIVKNITEVYTPIIEPKVTGAFVANLRNSGPNQGKKLIWDQSITYAIRRYNSCTKLAKWWKEEQVKYDKYDALFYVPSFASLVNLDLVKIREDIPNLCAAAANQQTG